ncbi:restriction endonuclease subunit S [Pseudanabaena sp. lw0831]|uniref:restriction endonuclease subunit S n=1 Tax=Pseudanabaena sp. lw0831 TaxID=1357935 RepID=UPI00191612A9|nr:restriction endonuclease subunit S [Pseudanabaena sp. lw0831]
MSSDFSILSDNDDLPMGWEWTNLDRILSIISGEAFKKKDYTTSGVKLLQIANVSFGEIVWEQQNFLPEDIAYQFPEIILKENDVVIALNRPIIGGRLKIARLKRQDTPSILYQRVGCFKSIDNDLIKYFFLYGQSHIFLKYIQENLQGSDQPYINTSCLPKLTIPLAPLNEQRRIVEKVEALMARSRKAKEALDTIPKLIEQFRQSVLAAAFRGDLTADWREQNPNIEPASVLSERIRKDLYEKMDQGTLSIDSKEETDKKIPKKWLWVSLSEIGKVSGGLTKNSTRNVLPLEFPYLRVANVYSNKLDLSEIKNIKIRSEELERVLLRKGDLLIVEGNGSLDQIGRASIWDGSIDPCLHQNHLIKVRFEPIEMSEYILFWLLSREGRSQIMQVASSTTGLHTLSLGKISKLQIPLIPLAEQHQIVTIIKELFDSIDRLFYQYQGAFSQLENLNQSILSKAFRGELVEQDPNDEPASVLLERIQKEREKEKAKVKQIGVKKLKK